MLTKLVKLVLRVVDKNVKKSPPTDLAFFLTKTTKRSTHLIIIMPLPQEINTMEITSSPAVAEVVQQTKTVKVYISGPMTTVSDKNKSAFEITELFFKKIGYEVVNPYDSSKERLACLKAGIRSLVECDIIFMLPGWENSEGAQLERLIARSLKIRELAFAVY
jgi:hypothetical protein